MPGLDKQGPEGRGPMTGWQRGVCRRTGKHPLADDINLPGRGSSNRRGSGKGRGQRQGRRFASIDGKIPALEAEDREKLQRLKEQYVEAEKVLLSIEEKMIALEGVK